MNPTCTNRNRTSEKWIELQTGMKSLTKMSKPHISIELTAQNKSKGQQNRKYSFTGSLDQFELKPSISPASIIVVVVVSMLVRKQLSDYELGESLWSQALSFDSAKFLFRRLDGFERTLSVLLSRIRVSHSERRLLFDLDILLRICQSTKTELCELVVFCFARGGSHGRCCASKPKFVPPPPQSSFRNAKISFYGSPAKSSCHIKCFQEAIRNVESGRPTPDLTILKPTVVVDCCSSSSCTAKYDKFTQTVFVDWQCTILRTSRSESSCLSEGWGTRIFEDKTLKVLSKPSRRWERNSASAESKDKLASRERTERANRSLSWFLTRRNAG